MQITTTQAPQLLIDVLRARKVPMIVSSPGIGKSSLAKQVADSLNLELIDVRLAQCDPTDLLGFPTIFKDEDGINTGKAGYMPMDIFPIEGDEPPEGKTGWLILFDELPSAALSVQAAAYKIILDKMVGQHHLHENVAMMGAGNLMTDRAIVNRMSTAIQSRMIHFHLISETEGWNNWAIKAEIDFRVIAWINFKPDALHKFDPDHNDFTFPCGRTWEFMSDIIKPWKTIEQDKLPILAGTVGEGMGREFFGYCRIFETLPTIQSIISNPESINIPDEPSIKYALSGLISNHLSDLNAENLMKFVIRLPIEFQVICLNTSLTRLGRTFAEHISIREWVTKNAQQLL